MTVTYPVKRPTVLRSVVQGRAGPTSAWHGRIIKRILTDRDAIMADYIEAALKKSPDEIHFFAAGAAHYTGKENIRVRLGKKGYKITRIEE